MILTRNGDAWGEIEIWEDYDHLIKFDGTFHAIDSDSGMFLDNITRFTVGEFKKLFPNIPLPRKGSKHIIERLNIVGYPAA